LTLPYQLEKDGNKYFVVDDTGKRYSDKPMPKWRASAQMRALWAVENNKKKERGLSVFKQADGSWRWFTISSSAFRDRDGEIITAKALADDVERTDASGSYGPLRWFHLGGFVAPDGLVRWDTWKAGPGIDIGYCDFGMLWGKMLLESGTFKSAELGEAFADVKELLEVSIQFSHPLNEPDDKKQFHNIHRFERSLLPAGMASNMTTKFNTIGGEPTMKTTEKLAALVAILKGKPELAQQILADAEGVQKAAEAAGLSSKEIIDELTGETAPETREVIEVSPPVVEAVKDNPPAEIAPDPVSGVVPEVVTEKAAPVVPPPAEAEPPEDEIGSLTHQQLADFVAAIVKQMMGKKEDDPALLASQKAAVDLVILQGQVKELAAATEKNQQSLFELTDARPAGIKQMQSRRPSESPNNLAATQPTGPQIDPAFRLFLQGGK
jgi:hypothetical protein